MPALVAGNHAVGSQGGLKIAALQFIAAAQRRGVDGRDKPGHDATKRLTLKDAARSRRLFLVLREELLARDGLVRDLHETRKMRDDALFVDRRAQRGERLLVVAVEVPDLLLLARKLPGPLDDGLGQVLLLDRHAGL